jgi:ABC-type multidrug transport system permease subunit
MNVSKNVGGRDRRFRAVLAVISTLVAAYALRFGRGSVGFVAAAAAVGFGFNAVTGFCGVNQVLGVDTTD